MNQRKRAGNPDGAEIIFIDFKDADGFGFDQVGDVPGRRIHGVVNFVDVFQTLREKTQKIADFSFLVHDVFNAVSKAEILVVQKDATEDQSAAKNRKQQNYY